MKQQPQTHQQTRIPFASKRDSFSTVWKRRLGTIEDIFSHTVSQYYETTRRLLTWSSPSEEVKLSVRLSSIANDFEWSRRAEKLLAIRSPILDDLYQEYQKDLYVATLGVGLAWFGVTAGSFLLASRAIVRVMKIPGTHSKASEILRYPPCFGVCTWYGAVGSYATYNFYNDRILHRCGFIDFPLSEGRCAKTDEMCSWVIQDFQSLWKEVRNEPKPRHAINHPNEETRFGRDIDCIANCHRRARFQDRLRKERGIAINSPLLPVNIPPPGIPKTGRFFNGELILPKEDGEGDRDGLLEDPEEKIDYY